MYLWGRRDWGWFLFSLFLQSFSNELIYLSYQKITKKEKKKIMWLDFSSLSLSLLLSHSLSLFFVFLVPSSKLSVIVVRKKCMSRFFTEVNHTIQNPPLGTVVDSEATRPEWQVLPENRCLTKHSLCVVRVRPCSVCHLPHVHFIFSLFLPQVWLLLGQPGRLSGNCQSHLL